MIIAVQIFRDPSILRSCAGAGKNCERARKQTPARGIESASAKFVLGIGHGASRTHQLLSSSCVRPGRDRTVPHSLSKPPAIFFRREDYLFLAVLTRSAQCRAPSAPTCSGCSRAPTCVPPPAPLHHAIEHVHGTAVFERGSAECAARRPAQRAASSMRCRAQATTSKPCSSPASRWR